VSRGWWAHAPIPAPADPCRFSIIDLVYGDPTAPTISRPVKGRTGGFRARIEPSTNRLIKSPVEQHLGAVDDRRRAEEALGAGGARQDHDVAPGACGLAQSADRALRAGTEVGHVRFLHARHCRHRARQPHRHTATENDDEIVNGVAANPNALGYVGYVHYERHQDRLHAARIDDLDEEIAPGPVEPSPNTVRRGLYCPLSRPLFLYVNTKRLDRPEVKAFVDFYTRNSESLAQRSGTIPLNSLLANLVQQRVAKRVEGSLFQHPNAASRSLEQLLTP
jgi:hypothetical protein